MTRVRQLPHTIITWGLMLLIVIAGGVRPSCICADGSLRAFCPNLMVAHSASPSGEPTAMSRSCASMSCCCGHSAKQKDSE